MSADNRTPHTDALATLGMIHSQAEARDAIHLGVEPIIAGVDLEVGEHICIMEGKAFPAAKNEGVGIVDPFLTRGPQQNESFWLIAYPRQITSLRHVWEHPSFPDSGETAQPGKPENDDLYLSCSC